MALKRLWSANNTSTTVKSRNIRRDVPGTHYSATRHKTVNGFDGPIFYPNMKRV
jgi:hypothetical protein